LFAANNGLLRYLQVMQFNMQWLEELLGIAKDKLAIFIKDHKPEYRDKSQGPLIIKVKTIDFLVN